MQVTKLRKFPYPYHAMLAISSDADHETLRKFNLIHQYVNTRDVLPNGKRGLGLDVADSFFMYNACDLPAPIDIGDLPIQSLFTYFKGTSKQRYGANLIDHYVHCGWMDTIHTYGDFSMFDESKTRFQRKLARRGIAALKIAGDTVNVWVDHGNKSNVDNFGSYGKSAFYDYQQGANPTSPYYHTDVTIPYGIHFVWADDISSVFGHDSMIYPICLPDGRLVWGFLRRTNDGESKTSGIDWDWSVGDLSRQLSQAHLQSLEKRGQYAILAQHLAANNTVDPLPNDAQQALQRLADDQRSGQILVARTSRLLQYNVAQKYIRYSVQPSQKLTHIVIHSIDDPVLGYHRPTLSDIRGITFYTTDPAKTVIEIENTPVDTRYIVRHPNDGVAPSIGISWYPPDTHNYAVWNAQVK